MKIAIANSLTFQEFALSELQTMTEADIIIFSFGVTGDADLAEEINGSTQVYAELVLLSLTQNCVVIAAMDTTIYGLKHKSAVVIDCGRIIDVGDMVHTIDDVYDKGKGFRVYDTSKGKLGIIIHIDLLYPESARMLTVCDSDMLISLIDDKFEGDVTVMARAASMANGIYNICSVPDTSFVCDELGGIKHFSRKQFLELDIEIKKDNKLIINRRKDKYREIYSNFL